MRLIVNGFLVTMLCFTIMGCASSPNKIQASYVSPLKYKDYTCDQIALEMDYIGQRTNELYMQLKKEADNDSAQMAVGMLLFWPALFFLEGGDGPQHAEYARLKGEFEALRQMSVQKNCMISSKSPEELMEELAEQEKK